MRYSKPSTVPQDPETLQLAGRLDNLRLIQELKEHHENNRPKEFFAVAERVLRIKHGNPVVRSVIGPEGDVFTEREEVNKRIAEYFEEVYSGQVDRDDGRYTEMLDHIFSAGEELDPRVDFTMEEIEDAVLECNFKKGLGPDGFNGEVINE